MFKYISMLKRRAGTSRAQLREYYEGEHAPLGLISLGNVRRYARRYLTPLTTESWASSYKDVLMNATAGSVAGASAAPAREPEFDVMVELWFDTRADFEAAFAELSKPETFQKMFRSGWDFLDIPKSLNFVIEEECDSVAQN